MLKNVLKRFVAARVHGLLDEILEEVLREVLEVEEEPKAKPKAKAKKEESAEEPKALLEEPKAKPKEAKPKEAKAEADLERVLRFISGLDVDTSTREKLEARARTLARKSLGDPGVVLGAYLSALKNSDVPTLNRMARMGYWDLGISLGLAGLITPPRALR